MSPSPRSCSLLVASVLMWLAAPARAELVIADSVEYLAARSELVARATVVSSAARGPAAGREWREVTVDVVEVLKGKSERRITFSSPWMSDVAPTGELLVFLVHGSTARHTPTALAQAWVATPQGFTFEVPFLSLAQERIPRVVSRTFAMLETRAALLAAVRGAVRDNPGVVDAAVTVDAPWGSAVATALYGGSAVMVRIPADTTAQRWAEAEISHEEVGRRLEATKVFAARRNDENVTRLKGLLTDPGFWPQRTEGVPGGFNLYPVRRLAFDTLKTWGVRVKPPVIEDPFTDGAP